MPKKEEHKEDNEKIELENKFAIIVSKLFELNNIYKQKNFKGTE